SEAYCRSCNLFFFSSRRRHTRSKRDWSSDVCSSDLAEIERLLAAPNADEPLAIRDGALLEFAYATGARVSELVGLKLQDVLYENGLARIFGKGSKERIVPVGRRALGAVALYARQIRPHVDRDYLRTVHKTFHPRG